MSGTISPIWLPPGITRNSLTGAGWFESESRRIDSPSDADNAALLPGGGGWRWVGRSNFRGIGFGTAVRVGLVTIPI